MHFFPILKIIKLQNVTSQAEFETWEWEVLSLRISNGQSPFQENIRKSDLLASLWSSGPNPSNKQYKEISDWGLQSIVVCWLGYLVLTREARVQVPATE